METKEKESDQPKRSQRKFSDQSIQVDDSATTSKEAEAYDTLFGRRVHITGFAIKQEGSFSTFKQYDIISEKQGSRLTVQRRFKDFEWLQENLIIAFYGLVLPRLPEKNIMATFDLEGEAYQTERMRLLERYLNVLLRKARVCRSPALQAFLSQSASDFAVFMNEQSPAEAADYLRVTAFEGMRQSLWSLVTDP